MDGVLQVTEIVTFSLPFWRNRHTEAVVLHEWSDLACYARTLR